VIGLVIAIAADGQGTFQNLDFESAIVPTLPPDQTAFIPFTNAFPGWSVGTNPAAVAGYNGISVGAALVSIIDGHTADYSNRVISGYFTAVIQSGNVSPPLTYGPASVAQTGLIPATAQSLLFAASGFAGYTSNFFVTLNGQNVPFTPLGAGPNLVTYGADISAFEGQTAELRFTSRPGSNPFTTVFLDDIRFSDLAIPEPSVFALSALGAVLIGWRRTPRKG